MRGSREGVGGTVGDAVAETGGNLPDRVKGDSGSGNRVTRVWDGGIRGGG